MYNLDKQKIKEILTDDQVYEYCEYMGLEPEEQGKYLTCITGCHNPVGEGHRHLYYYKNTKLFKCYSGCPEESFDIFELTRKILSRLQGKEVLLPEAIDYVASYFKIAPADFLRENINSEVIAKSFKQFEKYKQLVTKKSPQDIQLKIYNKDILNHFLKARIVLWEEEGISYEAIQRFNILYDPKNQGIIIPHYDINNNLIGIRTRTLNLDNIEKGKYRPTIIDGISYKYPLGFNLYGLNINKDNIKKCSKAIICESEKSVMQGDSILGPAANIIVACCGSNITSYQMNLLLSLGVKEVVIGFDRQWEKMGNDEWSRHWNLLEKLSHKFNRYINITIMEDSSGKLLGYKDSPTDKGKEIFMELYNKRRIAYES